MKANNWISMVILLMPGLLEEINALFIPKSSQRNQPISRFTEISSMQGDHYQQHPIPKADPLSRLTDFIRSNSRPDQRPVFHQNDTVEVFITGALYQIVEVDQRNNLATLSGYFDVHWMDAFVRWNVSEFDGIAKTFVPARWIWKPEFYLYHSIQGRMPEYANDASAEVHYNGKVRIFIPITSRALCPINVKYFPFDQQNCSFLCGSWSYQEQYVRLRVEERDVFLGDFYDNQEWLLVDANLYEGNIQYLKNESFSMVTMTLTLRRQSFYYVFVLVFPTTLVSLVAVIGFHAPINATGRRESKFRLGIMTLLSMSVMLLMLVDEMKFAFESIPGQRGSFSDVPLLGLFYMTLIFVISIATCTTSIFVHLEKFALRNQEFENIPFVLRWLAADWSGPERALRRVMRQPRRKSDNRNNIQLLNQIPEKSTTTTTFLNLAATDLSYDDEDEPQPSRPEASPALLTGVASIEQKLDTLQVLLRQVIAMKEAISRRNHLPLHWDRVLNRLENASLSFYLLVIGLNICFFLLPELWY